MVEAYRNAFSIWQGGEFLQHFQTAPLRDRSKRVLIATGIGHNCVTIDENIGGVTTPKGIYDIINQISVPTANWHSPVL